MNMIGVLNKVKELPGSHKLESKTYINKNK
jgi:hypothetical protein